MKRIARIALAAALLMGGTVLAMAQNGPATGGISAGAVEPQSLRLLWLLRATWLRAWNALLCSGLSGPALRLQTLAPLVVVVSSPHAFKEFAEGTCENLSCCPVCTFGGATHPRRTLTFASRS